MRIGIASDHAGYALKEYIKKRFKESMLEHVLIDYGTDSIDPVDYPDFASRVAHKVSIGELDAGILICGTGIGMCIVANKYFGVRAGIAYSEETASLLKRHNNANIICLGGRTMDFEEAFRRVLIWLESKFEGGRHNRRINKISKIEVGICRSSRLL